MFWYILSLLWSVIAFFGGILGSISLATYLLVAAYEKLLPAQNLKLKYNAEWALVTGSSSGIGKALAERLAQQGLNVVLVALDDAVFAKTYDELVKAYPSVKFVKVGTNLGDPTGKYMDDIKNATKGLVIQLVFNNAGYILPGFFADADIDRARANYECNATAAMYITHHFLRDMIANKRRGCFAYTSSAGQYMPGPTAALYASTKSFLTSFAISVAGEVKDVGIDVVVAHPSPVATNFYQGVTNVLSSLKGAMKAGVAPVVIADGILKCPGRLLVWDQGLMCAGFRILFKLLDYAFFHEVAARFAYLNPDHKPLAEKSKLRNPSA